MISFYNSWRKDLLQCMGSCQIGAPRGVVILSMGTLIRMSSRKLRGWLLQLNLSRLLRKRRFQHLDSMKTNLTKFEILLWYLVPSAQWPMKAFGTVCKHLVIFMRRKKLIDWHSQERWSLNLTQCTWTTQDLLKSPKYLSMVNTILLGHFSRHKLTEPKEVPSKCPPAKLRLTLILSWIRKNMFREWAIIKELKMVTRDLVRAPQV